MAASAYLDEAERWSKDLTRMRSRGPGDMDNAMRALERDYGIDYWIVWRLRYRRAQIRDIGVGVYMRLKAAYEAECARQLRKLESEIAATEHITGPDCDVVRKARALVAEGKQTGTGQVNERRDKGGADSDPGGGAG